MAKMTLPLEKMSYPQLLDLQKRVAQAITVRKANDAKEARRRIAELAAKSGYTMSELIGTNARRPAAIKYRNPKNDAETWSGRGRKPGWLVQALRKGGRIERFAV